jgi:para-aminobenzoate synthetase/4-amino-4-deoxychorismate lyase
VETVFDLKNKRKSLKRVFMKVVLKHAGKWLHFQCPEKVLVAKQVEDVLPMLQEAEESGLFAAGFVSYEAAPAFDSALKTHPAEGFPLLCLGLFHAPDVLKDIEEAPTSSFEVGELKPSVFRREFVSAIDEIKERIAEGATYQVNYTYRLNADFSGDAWAFFYELVKAQKTDYAAFVDTGDFAICSASPELFFSLNEGRIVSRPMKGTARRGRTFNEDANQAEALRTSEKDRAENIMIVDMIRNDIGRVAEPGSVETVSTYDVEKYATVWQMTSTVQGQLKKRTQSHKDTKVPEGSLSGSVALCDERKCSTFRIAKIMSALFPCASITGAPKAKTMEIIRGLETVPRKIYTGSIGFLTPQGEACFNVAIRTALIDQTAGTLEYGVGGGIVWDSNAEAEYEETLTKARVLTQPRPEFLLLETMLWEPEGGIFLIDEHMQRLGKSAAYFDIPLDQYGVLQGLEEISHTSQGVRMRIRLLVSQDGVFEVEAFPIAQCRTASPPAGGNAFRADEDRFSPAGRGNDTTPLRVKLAMEPIDSQDVFLFHKTTHRDVYENARADHPDADDVILWNGRGEVTESTIANLVIRKDGRLVTPPVDCGLLAGTFRGYLLKAGEIEESIISVDDLKAADAVYLINSVRKWQRVELEQPGISAED